MRPAASRPLLGCLTVLAVAGLTSPAGAATTVRQTGARPHATVVLRDIAFQRATVTVRRGGSVTWEWRDGSQSGIDAISHNVTSVGRLRFRSASTRDRGASTRRFTRAGIYRYECTIHVGMTGRVVVR